MNMDKMQVANTIYEQLGGHRFKTMTGAYDLMATDDGTAGMSPALCFKLPSCSAKNGINFVKIILDPSDTYTIEFAKWSWRARRKKFSEIEDMIYCDQLQEVFTEHTGLYTRL